MQKKNDVFYDRGLQFECTRCSHCCRHEPGYVFLTQTDLKTLANGTGLSENEFLEKYCRDVDVGLIERVSLKEKPNFDCIFWEKRGCSVYDYRPVQCRTYPFWSSNLISRATWDEEGKSCPGINHGKTYTRKQIDKLIRMREIERPLP